VGVDGEGPAARPVMVAAYPWQRGNTRRDAPGYGGLFYVLGEGVLFLWRRLRANGGWRMSVTSDEGFRQFRRFCGAFERSEKGGTQGRISEGS
jgi:hypothetical protein